VLRPSDDAPAGYVAEDNIIGGNVILFGATSGHAYIRGTVGERFAVRNSGAHAVVEGVGDHGCEYMTGGVVVVLGKVGRNFAAGMSGGIAYVWDPADELKHQLNMGHGSILVEAVEEPDDRSMLHRLVEDHYSRTGSERAQAILQGWTEEVGSFRKIWPREYRAMLEQLAQEAAQAGESAA
jgi:glutamate synthase (NADPH/NADH) large chain